MQDEDLIERRVRNGIIDYLELVSSRQAQLDYQDLAPSVHVPHEVINQWEDWTFEPAIPDGSSARHLPCRPHEIDGATSRTDPVRAAGEDWAAT